jgi:hypothetical protein
MNSLAYIENEVKILKSIAHVRKNIFFSITFAENVYVTENYCGGGTCI